jgi:hypothetical protein
MYSLVYRILTCVWAIAIYLTTAQSVIASPLAEKIAGYPQWGQAQVSQHEGELTYPEWFRGRWTATSTLLDQIAPLAPDIITPGFENNRQYIDRPVQFTVQFGPNNSTQITKFLPLNLPQLKSSGSTPKIVADRAFNGLNIATAYLGAANVTAVNIDSQNPTKQITQLTEDRQLETFVTGFDLERPSSDQFIATELSQQIFRTSSTIYLNTVETATSYQFLSTPTPTITATQISAIYLSPQDPAYFRTLGRAVAVYKYQLTLVPAALLSAHSP